MLGRLTLALENIPFFLQPGCKVLNKRSITFSNNSKVFAASTSSSSIRGQSCTLIFLDEFAFVHRSEEFYTATYPVISSGKNTQVIVTSTPNGLNNTFYSMWEAANQKTSNYAPFRVDWWDVPGRDEQWKKDTIANTSEIKFKTEFENCFIGTTNTLIEGDCLLSLQSEPPQETAKSGNLRIYEKPENGHFYIMTVDVSQGRGQDCSAFSVIDCTNNEFKQVVVFNDNKISPLLFPDLIVKMAQQYNDALLIVENNGPGQVVCNSIYYDYEYENLFVESSVKAGGIGVNTTRKVKRLGCSNLKDLIESKKLKIRDAATIIELSGFEEIGNSYGAKNGHDDLVMTLVLFSWFVSSTAFGDYNEIDMRKMIFESHMENIDNELMDIGFIVNDHRNDVGLSPEYERLKDDLEGWKV
jgi:hypothetical protein